MTLLDKVQQRNYIAIAQCVRLQLSPLESGERLFVDGDFTDVRGDHNVKIRQPSKEVVAEDSGAMDGESHVDVVPHL